MRTIWILFIAAVVVGASAWSLGCCSAPGATSLPSDESEIKVVGNGSPDGDPAASASKSDADSEKVVKTTPIPTDLTFQALNVKNVKGGSIRMVVPGTVEDVIAMLLDFDRAEGHRAWAKTYRKGAVSGDVTLAHWTFRGKMGIAPKVTLAFTVRRKDGDATIEFVLRKRAFGIASFFGDYKVRALAGIPVRTELIERVFIDSGIPIANASRKDIEKGLREDARLIRAWMEERLSNDK